MTWTILNSQWCCLVRRSKSQVSSESRIQHVLTDTEGPPELIEASGSEAGKHKPTWLDIWCLWTELYLTSYRVRSWWWCWRKNNTSLTFQLSASKGQSTAKKYRKRHEWLQLRRDEDVHGCFFCFFSFTVWSHSHNSPEQRRGKSPMTDINITLITIILLRESY